MGEWVAIFWPEYIFWNEYGCRYKQQQHLTHQVIHIIKGLYILCKNAAIISIYVNNIESL